MVHAAHEKKKKRIAQAAIRHSTFTRGILFLYQIARSPASADSGTLAGAPACVRAVRASSPRPDPELHAVDEDLAERIDGDRSALPVRACHAPPNLRTR